jgi:hypothetical protein
VTPSPFPPSSTLSLFYSLPSKRVGTVGTIAEKPLVFPGVPTLAIRQKGWEQGWEQYRFSHPLGEQ